MRQLGQLVLASSKENVLEAYRLLCNDDVQNDETSKRLALAANVYDFLREMATTVEVAEDSPVCIRIEPNGSIVGVTRETLNERALDSISCAFFAPREDEGDQLAEDILDALCGSDDDAEEEEWEEEEEGEEDGDGEDGEERDGEEEDEVQVPPRVSLGLSDWSDWLSFPVEENASKSDCEIVAHCMREMTRFGLDYRFQMREYGKIKHLCLRERIQSVRGQAFCNNCNTLLVPEFNGHHRCMICFDTDFCTQCHTRARTEENPIHPLDHRFLTLNTTREQQNILARTGSVAYDSSVPGPAA